MDFLSRLSFWELCVQLFCWNPASKPTSNKLFAQFQSNFPGTVNAKLKTSKDSFPYCVAAAVICIDLVKIHCKEIVFVEKYKCSDIHTYHDIKSPVKFMGFFFSACNYEKQDPIKIR